MDDLTDIQLKPVVKELVRTQVCFPDIRLLVEKIVIVYFSTIESSAGNEAYRLILTDKDKTIQVIYLASVIFFYRSLTIEKKLWSNTECTGSSVTA